MTATILSSGQAGTYRVRPHCRCRPGCLSSVLRDDDVTSTVDGTALTAHVEVVEHIAAVPCDVEDVAS